MGVSMEAEGAQTSGGHVASPLTALVVGGGPAGVVAAMMLCRRGFSVEVHEKRKRPRDLGDAPRSYSIVLVPRGLSVARREGISFAAQEATDFQGIFLHAPDGSPRRGPPTSTQNMLMFEGRQALAELFVSEAERLYGGPGGPLTFHWESALVDLDLQSRTARLRTAAAGAPGEEETVVQYDLLLGADGAGSAVRSCLVDQVPGFTFEKVVLPRQGKRFHRLPDTGFTGTGENSDRHTQSIHFYVLPQGLFLMRRNADNTISGGINMLNSQLPSYTTAQSFYEVLKPLQTIPEDAKHAIAASFVDTTWSSAGATVTCSQLHGPRAVLIGDAAHSVTPALGQGTNSAIEDTRVLEEVLERCGADLDQVGPTWTRQRGPDARALAALDKAAPYFQGLKGKRNPRFIVFYSHVIIGSILHKNQPSIFPKPAYTRMTDCNPPGFAHIRAAMRRDFVIAVSAAASVVGLVAFGTFTGAKALKTKWM